MPTRRSKKESNIQAEAQLALSEEGYLFWRNEVAGAWVGRVVHQDGGVVTLANARMLTFGLAVGSGDLIGIGDQGRFCSVEMKTERGAVRKEQRTWLDAVHRASGLAGIARTPEQAVAIARGLSI